MDNTGRYSSQVLALWQLVEGVKLRRLPTLRNFVCFRKAFDNILRCKILISFEYEAFQKN